MARIIHFGSTIMTMNALLLFCIQLDSAALPTTYKRSPQLQVHTVHGALKPGQEFNFLGKSFPDNTVRKGSAYSKWIPAEKEMPIVRSEQSQKFIDENQKLIDLARLAQERQQNFEAYYSSGVEKLMAEDISGARQSLGQADKYAKSEEKGNVAVLLALTEDSINKSEQGLEASLPQANRRDVLAAGNLSLGLIKFDNWIAGKEVSHAARPFLKAAISNGAEPGLPNLLLTEIAANDGDRATVNKQLAAGFGNLDETEETVKVLLADAYYARGACYHDEALKGQPPANSPKMTHLFEQATKDYQRSLSYFELSEVFVNYGTISYYQMHNPEQAKRQFEMAIVRDDRNDSAYYNLACYYSLTGSAELAVKYLRKAIQLNPENKEYAAVDPDFRNSLFHMGFQQLIR